MSPEAKECLSLLQTKLRRAAIAKIGGFRPPSDTTSSWFGAGSGLPDEGLPLWGGKPMFPLLQIRTTDLPFVPEQLHGIELLVLFHNSESHPFDRPHGEGWLIREYATIDGLVPLPTVSIPAAPRPFPIIWDEVTDDSPGWEDAWDLLDLSHVNDDAEASGEFFFKFNRYPATKVGGYPTEIQHGVGLDNYVFQVGSEEKPGWMWADNGIGYFFRDEHGDWSWSCQFY